MIFKALCCFIFPGLQLLLTFNCTLFLKKMKKLLFTLLIGQLISNPQKPLPRYEHDALYTTSGYKI